MDMTIEVWISIGIIILLLIGFGMYRTWCLVSQVALHTNSMHEELVKVTGAAELARGKLIGKEEAVKYVTDSDIERAAQLVATRVGDLVIAKLLKNHRFVPKEE